jgi:hypothetical protein
MPIPSQASPSVAATKLFPLVWLTSASCASPPLLQHSEYDFAQFVAVLLQVHALLDITPSGRQEAGGEGNMWWVKHKEDYDA